MVVPRSQRRELGHPVSLPPDPRHPPTSDMLASFVDDYSISVSAGSRFEDVPRV